MWRAYTREKPARQGLALLIVAISSALVAALAGSVISSKSAPILADVDAAPAGWPISFKVPADFEETTAIRPLQLDKSLVSDTRRLIFKSKSDAGRRLGVGYRASEEINEIMDATMQFVERTTAGPNEIHEPIAIPTIDPNWEVIRKTRPDSVTYLATLVMPDRSMVRIVYTGSRNQRLLTAVCDSVEMRPAADDPEHEP